MPIYNSMAIYGHKANIQAPGEQKASYVPGQGVSARIDDSSARIRLAGSTAQNEALQGLVKEVPKVVDAALKIYDDYSKTKATQLLTRYRQDMTTAMYGQDGFLSKRGEQAFNVEDERDRYAQKLRAGLLDGQNDRVKLYFSRLSADFDVSSSATMLRHQTSEYTKWKQTTDQAALNDYADEAARNYGDTQAFQRNVGAVMFHAGRLADEQGLSGVARERYVTEARDKAVVTAISQAINNHDLAGASRMIENWRGQLPPEMQTKLQAAYDQGVYRKFNALVGSGDYAGAKQVYEQARSGGGVRLPAEIAGIAEQEAQAQGVDLDLVKAVILTESGGRTNLTSKAGAHGPMQLMPGTAKQLGVDAKDPAANIKGGVTYLKQMLQRYNNNLELALMAYNWGPGNVDAYVKTGKGVNGQPVPAETRNYVPKVLKAMGQGDGLPTVSDPSIMATMEGHARKLDALKDISETQGMSLVDRQLELYKRAEKIPEGVQRSDYLSLVKQELKFQDDKETAEDGKQTVDFVAFGKQNQWTRAEWEQNIATAEGSGKYRPAAITAIRKQVDAIFDRRDKVNKREMDKIVADFKVRVDEQFRKTGVVSKDTSELDRMLAKDQITMDKYNECIDYMKKGGAAQNVTQTKMNTIWRKLTNPNNKTEPCPDEVMTWVYSQIGNEEQGKGRVVSDEELEKLVARGLTDAQVPWSFSAWDGEEKLYKAQNKGSTIYGVKVPAYLVPTVKAAMKRAGATDAEADNKDLQARFYAKMLNVGGVNGGK